MRITPNFKLRACFNSGMQIVGEENNDLMWIGTDKQRVLADMRIQDYIDLKEAEAKEREYENQVN